MMTDQRLPEGPVQGLAQWLQAMEADPLPGGVSAAAVAAAMGAALVAKAARIAQLRGRRARPDATQNEPMLKDLWELSCARSAELLGLAAADIDAYHAVIASRALPAHDTARSLAWAESTEVPIRVAEACQAVQDRLCFPCDLSSAAVRDDLHIGGWLLEVGRRSAVLAAESNLPAVVEPSVAEALRTRLDALEGRTA